MELSKQAQVPAAGTPAASRRSPLQSSQPASRAKPCPDECGAQVPISDYIIVPRTGASAGPSAAYRPEVGPASRVSLRPPPHLLNAQAASAPPGISVSPPSPSATGEEMTDDASATVNTLKPVPRERFVRMKMPARRMLRQSCESARAESRETPGATLGMQSDHLDADAGAASSLNEPESKRQKTSDEVTGGNNNGVLPVEVELGGDSLSHMTRPVEAQTKCDNRAKLHNGDKESGNTLGDQVGGKGNSNLHSNLEGCSANEKADSNLEECPANKKADTNLVECPANEKADNNLEECPATEKADTVQECMLGNLKDTENHPGIMSLDRFTKTTLDSNSDYEDHSNETAVDALPNKAAGIMLKPDRYHITGDKASAMSEFEFTCDMPSPKEKYRSKIESPKNLSVPSLCQAKPKGDMLINKASSTMMASEKLDTGCCNASIPGDTTHSNASPEATSTHCSLWEGTIQLNLSSLTDVVAIFRSGEKSSTNDWRRFLRIKGRVKLTDFQNFLEQLPKSRRRAVMVIELRCKEGSLESGRHHLLKTIDSYIADERVGLVDLAAGVELYLCPSHGKAAHILAKHLPTEHFSSLTVTGEAFIIGIVVWRRPQGWPDGSNRLSMPISKKHHAVIASSVPMPSLLTSSVPLHSNDQQCLNAAAADVSDAIPPGFGPCDVKQDSNLSGCNFVSVSTSQTSRIQQHVPAISCPSGQLSHPDHRYANSGGKNDVLRSPDQMRHLFHKHSNRYVSARPWDGNDSDSQSPDQGRQPVNSKCGDTYVPVQPWDDSDDDLRSMDKMRQLVRKYGNMNVPAQPLDRNIDGLRLREQMRQLVQKYGNRYVSVLPGDDNDDDLRPPAQVRQLVRRYSAHPRDNKDDDLPELYTDRIQSCHQQSRHPQPLFSQTGHDQQRDCYHRRRHDPLQEHDDEMLFQQQRAMAALGRNYQSVMHPAETLGRRSSTHGHIDGMPVDTGTPMQDVVRQSYFGDEPDTVSPRPTSLLGARRHM